MLTSPGNIYPMSYSSWNGQDAKMSTTEHILTDGTQGESSLLITGNEKDGKKFWKGILSTVLTNYKMVAENRIRRYNVDRETTFVYLVKRPGGHQEHNNEFIEM